MSNAYRAYRTIERRRCRQVMVGSVPVGGDAPISVQTMPEKPVRIGNGSWLGYGTVVLPGADIGEHVVIGANSVVTGTIPSFSVAVGSPAKVVRRYVNGAWEPVVS